ncbi:gfo/Idh/MocA family oxidoreductase, partial [bacterium]|nr:gfo/Idh/MocA family oxidoreductase [bacterium]
NFLDCIKSRKKCNADIEIGHRSNTMCLLANIAYKTKSLIEWDLKEERITNNHTLNQYLHYEYRAPWKL